MNKQGCSKYGTNHAIAGIVLLFFGYGFYLFFRNPGMTVMQAWPVSQALMRHLPHPDGLSGWVGWMPSFLYVLAMSLLSISTTGPGPGKRFIIPLFWFIVATAFEAGQYAHFSVKELVPAAWTGATVVRLLDDYFVLGTFDPLDVAAGFGGMLAATAFFAWMRGGLLAPEAKHAAVRCLRATGSFTISLLGIACLLATSRYVPCEPNADPVYLSYDELRKPVTAMAPVAVTTAGKIYVYGSLILFNEPNQGIHVIDNIDPQSPQNLLFLPIPGNIDIAVKDDVLYADSYIDLVAIDISNKSNIHEITRIQAVFPYDPYQNIQNRGVNFCTFDSNQNIVDSRQGVVVDFKMR